MKIALVFPPVLNSIQTTIPEFINENEGYFPPLGVMYIASYLKKHKDDCDIFVIDSSVEKLNHIQTAQRIVDFGVDIVGLSCWTFSLLDTLAVASQVKRISPATLVCLGGPHVNIYPKETLSMDCVDFVITGDGERPFAKLIDQLKTHYDFAKVPNLHYKKNGRLENSLLKHVEENLDELPFPDRNWTPFQQYYTILDRERPVTTMITSRGCPFKCSFCFQHGTGWRCRSVSNIIDEIQYCTGLGIRNFFIFDETFTVNKQRVIELCDEIKRRYLNITWSCRSRVDTIDEETMGRLKEAGCQRISFGVEAANDDVLRRLNKKIVISQVKRIFKAAKKKRITTLADFMIGCPGEDRKKTYETIKLAVELNPDYAQFCLFTLFPATKLYEEALKEGVVNRDVWLDYAKKPEFDFKPPLWNIYSEEEAKRLLAISYRRFYLRFSYILKRLFSVRSIAQFKTYLKSGIGLIKIALSSSKRCF